MKNTYYKASKPCAKCKDGELGLAIKEGKYYLECGKCGNKFEVLLK